MGRRPRGHGSDPGAVVQAKDRKRAKCPDACLHPPKTGGGHLFCGSTSTPSRFPYHYHRRRRPAVAAHQQQPPFRRSRGPKKPGRSGGMGHMHVIMETCTQKRGGEREEELESEREREKVRGKRKETARATASAW